WSGRRSRRRRRGQPAAAFSPRTPGPSIGCPDEGRHDHAATRRPRMIASVRKLYEYHWWANRRLFEVASALGAEAVARPVGAQFSYQTLGEMLAHLYRADALWLNRWKGIAGASAGSEVPTLPVLRERWDALEHEQGLFLDALTAADLERAVEYT